MESSLKSDDLERKYKMILAGFGHSMKDICNYKGMLFMVYGRWHFRKLVKNSYFGNCRFN
jgi:hypothetical protein